MVACDDNETFVLDFRRDWARKILSSEGRPAFSGFVGGREKSKAGSLYSVAEPRELFLGCNALYLVSYLMIVDRLRDSGTGKSRRRERSQKGLNRRRVLDQDEISGHALFRAGHCEVFR